MQRKLFDFPDDLCHLYANKTLKVLYIWYFNIYQDRLKGYCSLTRQAKVFILEGQICCCLNMQEKDFFIFDIHPRSSSVKDNNPKPVKIDIHLSKSRLNMLYAM